MKSGLASFMRLTCLMLIALLSIGLVSSTAWAGITYISTASGPWSTMVWNPVGVPGAGDDVIIADGNTVVIDQAVSITNLTVGQGLSGKLTFDGVAARAVSLTGNLTIAPGGIFITQAQVAPIGDVATGSATITNVTPDPTTTAIAVGMNVNGTGIPAAATVVSWTNNSITVSLVATANALATQLVITNTFANTLALTGNLTNDGTFDMSQLVGFTALATCNVTFNATVNQLVTGTTPVLTRFRGVTLNKGGIGNEVLCNIDVSKSGSGTFLLTAGTWEQTAGMLTFSNGNEVWGAAGGLKITGSASFADPGASLGSSTPFVQGILTVNTTGTFAQGSGNNSINIGSGGTCSLTAGTITLYGKLGLQSGSNTTINGANITIHQQGTALAPRSANFVSRTKRAGCTRFLRNRSQRCSGNSRRLFDA